MRLYVVGAEGQVARSLREAAAKDAGIVLGYGARPDVDLQQPATIERAIAEFAPDVVINPAAYTAVDKAETEPDLAFALNRDGARVVAAAAATAGAPIIHLSTDYVFDGSKDAAYIESDPVGPQGVYGRSKLEGERAVASANPRHIVLRTAWVYSPFGGNFVKTVLRLSSERDRLRIVNDQIGCPTYAPDIAAAILSMSRKLVDGGWEPTFAGVTHLAGPDAVTWYEFACRIVESAAKLGGVAVPVDPISTSEFPTPAKRPANSRLSTARLQSVFGEQLPPMAKSLANCIERLRAGNR